MAVNLEYEAPILSCAGQLEYAAEGIDNDKRVVVLAQHVGENGNSRLMHTYLPDEISQEVIESADSWSRCRIGEGYYNVMWEMVLGLFGMFPED